MIPALQQRTHIIIQMFMGRMSWHAGRLVYNDKIFILIQNIRFAQNSLCMGRILFRKDQMHNITCFDRLGYTAGNIIEKESIGEFETGDFSSGKMKRLR